MILEHFLTAPFVFNNATFYKFFFIIVLVIHPLLRFKQVSETKTANHHQVFQSKQDEMRNLYTKLYIHHLYYVTNHLDLYFGMAIFFL